MTERVSVKPKIIDLQDTNDIFMKLHIAILSNVENFNKAEFTSDFIDGVISNKEHHVGIPFLVNRSKLENGDYDNLSHELDLNTGTLNTDQIGSFVDFWKEEIDGADCLMGSIKVFKRFPQTCEAVTELFGQGFLETSCEVLINSYLEVTDEGVRRIHYNNGNNALAGSAIVSSPAEKRAKGTLLVAEAYQKDMEQQKGAGIMTEKEIAQMQVDLETANKKLETANKDLEVLKSQKEKEVSELQENLDKIKGEKETMSEELQQQVTDLQEKLAKAQTDLEQANEMVVSEQEAKQNLDSQIQELNTQMQELQTYKDTYEKAEKERQQKELSEKYAKLFDEETFKSEEIQNAIESCDTVSLNSRLVDEIAKQKQSSVETASQNKDVVFYTQQSNDLIEPTVMQKYGLDV